MPFVDDGGGLGGLGGDLDTVNRDYYSGGHGVDPHAAHPHGAAKDLFSAAPQFLEGAPLDTQKRVSKDTFVKFGTYYYGSHCYVSRMRVETSVDGAGASFEDVFLGSDVASELGRTAGYQAGYDGRVFRADGHNVTFIFLRDNDWPDGKTIYLRFTGVDGYGREAQKTTLVTWG